MLTSLFQQFGPVAKASIISGPTGASTGYGFVEFGNRVACVSAMKCMHEETFCGQKLNIVLAKPPPEEAAPKPQRTGGWGGHGGYGNQWQSGQNYGGYSQWGNYNYNQGYNQQGYNQQGYGQQSGYSGQQGYDPQALRNNTLNNTTNNITVNKLVMVKQREVEPLVRTHMALVAMDKDNKDKDSKAHTKDNNNNIDDNKFPPLALALIISKRDMIMHATPYLPLS
eukprot:CAMPEP_0168535790 /NCGR_PEP_ID=MMETSP0405-20121227/19014_1 /TAXON_ID=498012 /ORGANISM="Trichosphaerium sp, Strain Am-I-7 wt" /LENGTH=224 /DNA_ID=CAMNT_0008563373 /DNA_START=259 /DNA_END=934 /DNA_ORIENTATION=-